VSAGVGVAIVVGFLDKLFDKDIVFVPLVEPRFDLPFSICWLRDNRAAQVREFVKLVQDGIPDR